ncbi:amidase family protein [Bartonella tamiae]|uniref:Amidase domain-containing protein n=1 Tax=Bartonella tamiae Th239 TaxID=1094558 RepID=J0R0U2_9HYPH|nr:amidase family protein [Bartonella tamiae]EJF89144.1 hypothetical protein ME5_01695 [Bartonella tamiae Th239]EJF95453.1 hypothetical protein MEG_00186 [Bartonella tamiae Th307]
MNALEMSKKYEEGSLTPIALLEPIAEMIKANPYVFISTTYERAYREAEASTKRWQTMTPLSPFDGVPIAYKDLFDVAGTLTTAGAATCLKAPKAQNDASVVAKLAQFGMVCIGKTNLTEFAYSGLGLNKYFGTPSNACDEDYIPGGSLSGAAVCVAKNIVPLSFGTDTAGSICIPACFNGVIGYRSSMKRYAQQGVYPLASSLDTIGPLAKSVKDCIILDQLLRSSNEEDTCLMHDVEDMKLIVDWDFITAQNIQAEVMTQFNQCIDHLKECGVNIVEKTIFAFSDALDVIDYFGWPALAEAYTLHKPLLESDQSAFLDPRVRKRLDDAQTILASTQITLYQKMTKLRSQLRNQLRGYFLLTPTVAHMAPLIKPLENEALYYETNLKTLRLAMPGSFLDMPSVTLPNRFRKKTLPSGLLVSGVSGNDRNLLQACYEIECLLKNKM